MVSKSWGHVLRLLSDVEREKLAGYGYRCRIGKGHDEPVTYAGEYRYVTGRAGRVSTAEKRLCAAHAEKFAKTNDLEMPTDPGKRKPRPMDIAMQDFFPIAPPAGGA